MHFNRNIENNLSIAEQSDSGQKTGTIIKKIQMFYAHTCVFKKKI
jgi:hypothetical protein